MPSLTKWNVVPPGRSHGSRSVWVTTNTGVWNGASSGHIASPPSNMRLPRMVTPVRSKVCRAMSSSGPVSPPSPIPRFSRKNRCASSQSCSAAHWFPQST